MLFVLFLIAGSLLAVMPVSEPQQGVVLGVTEGGVTLSFTRPESIEATARVEIAKTEIDTASVAEIPSPPTPAIREPIPLDPTVVDEAVADDPAVVIVSPEPVVVADVAEDVAQAPILTDPIPEPMVDSAVAMAAPAPEEMPAPDGEEMAAADPIPEPVTEAAAAVVAPELDEISAPVTTVMSEPEQTLDSIVNAAAKTASPEPDMASAGETAQSETEIEVDPQPSPDIAVPSTQLAAMSLTGEDSEPVLYVVGRLEPDEAAAMPGDEHPLPKTPDKPLSKTLEDPMLDPTKAPADPVRLAYARPSDDTDDNPRIAVVIAGLGLGRAATMAAIKLPGTVTLAFASYSRDLQKWIDLARAAGHEVLLDLPMEPENYPALDPGPQALLTSLTVAENTERLNWHLSRAVGYVGVTHNMGSRFTSSAEQMRPMLSALKTRGLLFLDARTSANSVAAGLATDIGLPRAINNRFLDSPASRSSIDKRIDEIERIARRVGFSVAFSHAYPVTIERLERWIGTLDGKSLSLVPVSALVDKQQAK